jgi:hypothetical protein
MVSAAITTDAHVRVEEGPLFSRFTYQELDIHAANKTCVEYVNAHEGEELAEAIRRVLRELKTQSLRETEIRGMVERMGNHIDEALGGRS